jgi:septum formation protein
MILFTSVSTRRKALLQQVGFRENEHFNLVDGVAYHVYPDNLTLEDAGAQAIKAARKKIDFVVKGRLWLSELSLPPEETVVAAADTVVYLNGRVLDTPMGINPAYATPQQIRTGQEKARQTLLDQSGQSIYVITGLVIAQGDNLENKRSRAVVTKAQMKAFSSEEVDRYVRTGEPLEKAGAFGIQGLGVILFEKIEGSYSNIVGLPLVEFITLLRDPLFKGRVVFPSFPSKVISSNDVQERVGSPELSVVSMGDINYDLMFGELPPNFFEKLQSPGVHQEGELYRAAGGTGVVFATRALEAGFQSCSVLGVIGGDALGHSIEEELHNKRIRMLLPRAFGKNTGVSLLLRDTAEKDTVLMLTDSRQSLSKNDVEKAKSDIERADVLFVSGYCLADSGRKDAACEAMQIAKRAGRLVVLDVTIDMEKKFSFAEFTNLLDGSLGWQVGVDVLVSEIHTILAWLGLSDRKENDWDFVRNSVLPVLHEKFPTIFLRTSTYSHEIISSPSGMTGPIALDYFQRRPNERLGYGDERTARHLYKYLSPRLLLASASPRRLQLLMQIVADNKIEVRSSSHGEEYVKGEYPMNRVQRLAMEKARQVMKKNEFSPGIEIIIGADTEIILKNSDGEYEEIGHPASEAEARQALRRLSGKAHQAITGIALIQRDPGTGKIKVDPVTGEHREMTECVTTKVTFRELSDDEINEYVQSGEPFGKAGAYGIQEKGALLIEKIEGSYSNVVGLPLERLSDILASKFDMPVWNMDKISNWILPQWLGDGL